MTLRTLMRSCRVALMLAILSSLAPAVAQNTDTYFGTPGGGGVNGRLGIAQLPRTWRISTAIVGTTPSVTATIGASVIE